MIWSNGAGPGEIEAHRGNTAADALPFYEEEARKWMLAGKKADPPEIFPEGKGDALEHASRDFKVSGHYISDVKTIKDRAAAIRCRDKRLGRKQKGAAKSFATT